MTDYIFAIRHLFPKPLQRCYRFLPMGLCHFPAPLLTRYTDAAKTAPSANFARGAEAAAVSKIDIPFPSLPHAKSRSSVKHKTARVSTNPAAVHSIASPSLPYRFPKPLGAAGLGSKLSAV